MKIKNITVLICQNNVQKIQDKYKSSSLLFSVIKRIFKYAYHLEIIRENPMDKVIIPRKKYTEENQEEQLDNFYTRTELLEFLNKCQNSRSPFNVTFFHVLGYTGLRKGEALGLKWKDIDFQNKTLKVARTAAKVDGKQFCQSPKTKKSRRTISIDDHTISLLKTWKIHQMKRFMAHGVRFEGDEQYIFTNRDCKWYSYNHIFNLNNVLAKRFNMRRITIHGFRHTHCSLLFESGATIKEVQERLGHSNIKTTMEIYAHVTKERHEQVANRFNEYMSERKEA
ncbi:site-specific integrase [Streptococcus anginosus]|nr:site-specific integrase [Streptococcus anginosus]